MDLWLVYMYPFCAWISVYFTVCIPQRQKLNYFIHLTDSLAHRNQVTLILYVIGTHYISFCNENWLVYPHFFISVSFPVMFFSILSWHLSFFEFGLFNVIDKEEIMVLTHGPTYLETFRRPEHAQWVVVKYLKATSIVPLEVCRGNHTSSILYMELKFTRNTHSNHHNFSIWNDQLYHCCYSLLPVIKNRYIRNYIKTRGCVTQFFLSLISHTSWITLYMGKTMLLRKDSDSPP